MGSLLVTLLSLASYLTASLLDLLPPSTSQPSGDPGYGVDTLSLKLGSFQSPSITVTSLQIACQAALVVVVALLLAAYAMSFGVVSLVIPCEIFPYRARSKAASLTMSWYTLLLFLGPGAYTGTWFQWSHSDVKQYSLSLSIGSILLGILYYLTIPETFRISLDLYL